MSFVGHTREEEGRMLAEIGVSSIEQLLAQIPEEMRLKGLLDLPPAQSEVELRRSFLELASRNYDPETTVSFLGAGIYDHAIPAAIDPIASRSEFYTAYTPYQAEVSQGTLAVIFEFQTMICELTGMDVANASMYDGASAAGEALLLARAATRRQRVLVAAGVNPRVRGVVETYASGIGLEIETLAETGGRVDSGDLSGALTGAPGVAAVLVQQPNFYGLLESLDEIGEIVGAAGSHRPHLVVSADPLSLGLLAPPGACGAETVVGDLQPLGIPAQFGGPTAGYFATRRVHVRRLPGRLVAETTDSAGRRGFTLTLQAREQHIRREKATSNICTNSALMALRTTVYLALLGPQGLREAAERSLKQSHYALSRLEAIRGVTRTYRGPFFREFAIRLPSDAEELVCRIARKEGILAGVPLSRFDPRRKQELLVAVTEKRTGSEIEALEQAMRGALS